MLWRHVTNWGYSDRGGAGRCCVFAERRSASNIHCADIHDRACHDPGARDNQHLDNRAGDDDNLRRPP